MNTELLIKNNIEKILVSVGVGKKRQQANFDEKILPEITKELALITGQKPSPRQAKKSIAGFKLRQGEVVGLLITLRGKRMEDFFTRFVSYALPRVMDFRGIDLKNVDGVGNLNVGLKEQFIFPEINPEDSRVTFGLQVTMVPYIKNREKAIDFYKSVGVPLKRD